MNQITPPPHEATPAQEPPTDHTVRPATLPVKRSNGRLILGTVVTEDPDRARVAGFVIHLGVGEGFALGYAALSKAKPALVYCSISGFGQTGPGRNWTAQWSRPSAWSSTASGRRSIPPTCPPASPPRRWWWPE